MIPHRALSFQHRAAAEQLRAAVDSGGTAVLGQVLTGTGGVGKTQLAADYARTAWEAGGVDVLVWISAGTRQAIVAGYAQAGVEVLAADPGDPEQAAKMVLAWLEPKSGREPCRWLVVLDDVADPADLRGLWPPASHGRTLVTTRRRDAALTGQGRRRVDVGLFTPEEATAYLTAALAAHGRHEWADQINALAADLGYLPLALAQAAAYLIDTARTCADYRALLADRARTLDVLLPEPGALPDDQTATVAATWSLSIERADQLRPPGLARPMLQLAAMLDPNGIPGPVLTGEPALAYLAAHRTPGDSGREPVPATADDAAGALQALHRLSLIDHTPDTPHQAVRVHALIQRATRDALTPGRHDQLARTAADTLTATWPAIERDTDLAQTLRANTDALTRTAEDALYQPHAHPVLYRTGRSLGESGQATAARNHSHHLTAQTHRRLGPDHPDTLTARSQLARWRGIAGDAAGAATATAALLTDRLRVQGPDHPDTLATRHELAYWRGIAGDAAGAATAFAALLTDHVRVLGPDHPHTLTARHELARWRGTAGDAAGAATAFAALLTDRLRVQGPDHPHTLTARHNLASWQGIAGDAAGAATATAALLTDRLRVQGPDHPDTLTTRSQLARWRGTAGDAAGAATAFAALLTDHVRVLGPDHPDTLTARSQLARWRGIAGDAAGAATAFAALLTDRERVLGPDHPHTLTARHELARWRGIAGDAAGAATAFADLLTDHVRVLGPDHPDTLATRHELAYWRGTAGDAAGAAAFAALLTDRERVLGPDHPHTLATRHTLAYWRGTAGDAAGAATAFADLLTDRLRVLGPDHPRTLATRHNLAYWRDRAEGGGASVG
ncbi:tetratricopeptide repeat protein [Actinacidiphila oryziradicis]|uniref:Tetratricopeptide repeat protein n=1 Tax=Actinacidiphila oryziradicis TaxID=2571141 RepID=A0A4U0RLS8_9ACTN|nr:tetratricopeptide repeat protein [Actinacidiphila oryziradicis]